MIHPTSPRDDREPSERLTVTLRYRGVAYVLDIVSCVQAIRSRADPYEPDSIASTAGALGLSAHVMRRLFSGRRKLLLQALLILCELSDDGGPHGTNGVATRRVPIDPRPGESEGGVAETPTLTGEDEVRDRPGDSSPRYISLKQAALTARVSQRTLLRWRKRGLLNGYRARGIDRCLYVDLEELLTLRKHAWHPRPPFN